MPTHRYRERQLLGPSTGECLQVFEDSTPDNMFATPIVVDDADTMSDYVVERFHQRIAAGEIINNPCVYRRSTRSVTGSMQFLKYSNGSLVYTITGPYTARNREAGNVPSQLDVEIEDTQRRCKLVALANLDSTPYAFGEDVLEIKETLKFLKNPIGSLLDLSTQFRRAYRKKRAAAKDGYELLQAHSAVWLQYQFAFSPLVRSAQDVLEVYQSKPPHIPERVSSRGIVNNEASDTRSIAGWADFVYDETVDRTREGKASILYEVSNPVRDWNFRLGLRAKDIPTTLWQVFPLSFMVDRLVDISSFSKGVINLADPRVKVLSGCYRVKDFKKNTLLISDRNDPDTTILSSDTVTDTEFSYQRAVWHPSVEDTVPELTPRNVVDTATKMTDTLALIIANVNPF